VRPNSVIPIGNHTDQPGYDYSDGVTLQVYQLEDGKTVSVEIPTFAGKIETSFDIERKGNTINVLRQGPAKAWNVLLVGIEAVEKTENTENETLKGSALIKAKPHMNSLKIHLKSNS